MTTTPPQSSTGSPTATRSAWRSCFGYSATDARGDRATIEAEAIRDVIHRHRVAGRADAAYVGEVVVEDAPMGRGPRRRQPAPRGRSATVRQTRRRPG